MVNRIKTVDAVGNVIRIDNEDELIKSMVYSKIFTKISQNQRKRKLLKRKSLAL